MKKLTRKPKAKSSKPVERMTISEMVFSIHLDIITMRNLVEKVSDTVTIKAHALHQMSENRRLVEKVHQLEQKVLELTRAKADER